MAISESQLINKMLEEKDFSYAIDNRITEEFFTQCKDEYIYIESFYRKYSSMPDKESFAEKFPDWEFYKVSQPIKSILDELRENLIFRRAVELINNSSKIFEEDSRKGAEFLLANIDKLSLKEEFECDDIVHSKSAYKEYEKILENKEGNFIPLPFPEIEKDIGGFRRGEELFLWLARSGRGKSICLALTANVASKAGYRVGIISPEMRTTTFATRIQSARSHLSNVAMNRGFLLNGYKEFVDEWAKSDEHIFIADISNFDEGITVQDCENFIHAKKLDILLIDGISYIRSNTKARLSTTEIMGKTCEGLLALSTKYKLPVVGVVQARRKGTNGEDEESVDEQSTFMSYMVTQIATRIISISKVASGLKFKIPKNRYGVDNLEWVYACDFDRMNFTYLPKEKDVEEDESLKEVKKSLKHAF